MTEIKFNEDVFLIPSIWNQLSREQLMKIASLSLQSINHVDFKLKLFLFIAGLKVAITPEIEEVDETLFLFRKSKSKQYLLSSDDILGVCDSLNFLFDIEQVNGKKQYFLNSKLTKNIIGPIRVANELWFGPADALTNLKTDEYIRAEHSIFQYHKTQDEFYLNKLIACLWRPAAAVPASDDIRVKFDDGIVNASAILASNIAPEIKQGIYLFYSGSRKFLSARFPHSSNGKPSDDKDIFLLFLKMVNGLANNDVTKHEAVRAAYLMDTLVCIDEFARQQQEFEKINKKTR
jgi:hypothetical protein